MPGCCLKENLGSTVHEFNVDVNFVLIAADYINDK